MSPLSFSSSARPPCHAEAALPASLSSKGAARKEAMADTDGSDPLEGATVHTRPEGQKPLAAPGPTLIGSFLEDYEVLEELGRGGMGIVYKARQISLQRLVALKILPLDALNDKAREARFLQEARAIASLSHPNIVSVHQLGRCESGQYFVMDFVEGPSLEALAQRPCLPLAWVVNVMVIVAEAMHYSHGKGVLHRDLKPANILIEDGRRPVIIDFGLAKFLTACSSLTVEGTIMGSPSYMAPEQAGKDNVPVSVASDIYSLGAILYALLTGRPPYDEGSFLGTVLKVVAPELPPSVRSLAPRVPGELDRICMKCLSKKPADRYSTAHTLAEALRRFRARTRREAARTPSRFPGVMLVATGTGQQIRLGGLRQVMGSAKGCAVLLRSPEVDRQHCQILVRPDQAILEDLGSRRGTFVNGQRVRRVPLKNGDELKIGPFSFRVQVVR